MLDFDSRVDAAANEKIPLHFDPPRIERGDEIIGDPIRHRFVECPLISVGPEIELERLELYACFIGNITNADGGEIGLASEGAEARELGSLEGDFVVPGWIRIRKG